MQSACGDVGIRRMPSIEVEEAMALCVLGVSMMDGMACVAGTDGRGMHHHRTAPHRIHPFKCCWWGVKHCSSRPLTGEAIEIWGRHPTGNVLAQHRALSGLKAPIPSFLPLRKEPPKTSLHVATTGRYGELPTELAPLQRCAGYQDHRWRSLRYQRHKRDQPLFCCFWPALRPRETRRRPPWSGQRTDLGFPLNINVDAWNIRCAFWPFSSTSSTMFERADLRGFILAFANPAALWTPTPIQNLRATADLNSQASIAASGAWCLVLVAWCCGCR